MQNDVLPVGEVVVTVLAMLEIDHLDLLTSLTRHRQGDWGYQGPDGRARNDQALAAGEQICSHYRDSKGEPFHILTVADRSLTLVFVDEDHDRFTGRAPSLPF